MEGIDEVVVWWLGKYEYVVGCVFWSLITASAKVGRADFSGGQIECQLLCDNPPGSPYLTFDSAKQIAAIV